MKTLEKIILTNGDTVTPHIFQYLIELDKTVELWDKTRHHRRRRIKRWIKSKHILWIFPVGQKKEQSKCQ